MDLSAIKAEYETTAKKVPARSRHRLRAPHPRRFLPEATSNSLLSPIRAQIRRLSLIAADDDLDA